MHKNKEIVEKTKNLKEIACEIDLLLVEDDEILLNQMHRLLCKFFRRIDLAGNGLEGLNRLSERDYDLVITDLTMPIIDGFSLIENIRKHNSEQTILVLSAHSESEKLLRLIDMKIDGFLLKPVNMDIVLLKLLNTCRDIYNKKELEQYLQSLESDKREVAEDETSVQKAKKPKNSISAIEFAKLYPYEIAYVNEELELLQDKLDAFFVQQEKERDYKTIDTILEILKEYVKHLDNFIEFKDLVNDFELMIRDCETIRMNIEIVMPSLILLFENFEQFRRGVFESQSAENIYAYDKNFRVIFEQIKRDRDEALEVVKEILS